MNFRDGNINNQKHLVDKRKALRNNLTPAEATLWLNLKNKQLQGRRFRRQFSVGNYIIDFYCPEEKLGIELDGHHHFTPEGRYNDEERDLFLSSQGIKILRFENKFVFEQRLSVLDHIRNNFRQ